MNAAKLLHIRKDGTLGSLFINRAAVIPVGVWLDAADHPTKGYAHRPGWHCMGSRFAPHLSEKGRIWLDVEIEEYVTHHVPQSQGSIWYLAQRMKVLGDVQSTLL